MELFGEQIEIVRGLWDAGPFSFAGRHYRLGPVDPLPKPENPWLVVGGAAGPKSVALAARDARKHAIGERRDDPHFEPPPSWVHGTLDEARAQLSDLAQAGVDRVMLQLLLHEDLEQIELIGRELGP